MRESIQKWCTRPDGVEKEARDRYNAQHGTAGGNHRVTQSLVAG
jgi:hypothetical protein